MAKNKYTDVDDSSLNDKWKNKYLASLEDLEVKEHQWRDSEKNLRALISHLTNAADNSSLKLNEQLSVLRDAVNKGVPANKLKKAIDEVADSILGLDALREKKKNETKNLFVELLGKIKPAGEIESKLSKISSKISKTSSVKEISPLINDLAKLLVHGLSLGEKKKDKDKSFLSSLIKKYDEPEVKIIEKIKEVTSEEALDLSEAIKSLTSLLEKMILPADLQVEANLVKRKLEQSANEEIFLISLEKTVAITADVLNRVKKEKKEIEEFLK